MRPFKLNRRAAIIAGLSAMSLFTGVLNAPALSIDDIRQKRKITVGVMLDFVPFGFLNKDNQPDGYDADFARLLAKRLGVDVELVPIAGPSRIPYLMTGKVDILVAALAITPERAKQVRFSEPYAGMRTVLYARKDLRIADFADLADVKISIERATTADAAITKSAPKTAVIQRFADASSAVQAVVTGQVDAIGVSELVPPQIEAREPNLKGKYEPKFVLSQQVHGVAVRPDSESLLELINREIEAARASGDLNAIHRKWLASDYPDYKAPSN